MRIGCKKKFHSPLSGLIIKLFEVPPFTEIKQDKKIKNAFAPSKTALLNIYQYFIHPFSIKSNCVKVAGTSQRISQNRKLFT